MAANMWQLQQRQGLSCWLDSTSIAHGGLAHSLSTSRRCSLTTYRPGMLTSYKGECQGRPMSITLQQARADTGSFGVKIWGGEGGGGGVVGGREMLNQLILGCTLPTDMAGYLCSLEGSLELLNGLLALTQMGLSLLLCRVEIGRLSHQPLHLSISIT